MSILAEIVQNRRGGKPEWPEDEEHRIASGAASLPLEAKDPVCGMLVEVAAAKYRAEASGRVVYFCCAGCKDAFERDPQRYAATLAG